MPKLPSDKLPKYREHKASGQAIVTLNGHDHYLGPYGSPESKAAYDRITAEWLSNGRRLPLCTDPTIAEMLVEYWRFAQQHYRKDGQPTQELINIKSALRPVRAAYSRLAVRDFGPLKLKAIQGMLVKGYLDANGDAVAGLARRTVNARISAIKRVFRWAVSEEMAPPGLAHALDTVRGLQRGRTEARETAPVVPVSDETVEATLLHLPALLADMVRIQRLTGCRPGEVCVIRPGDIDCSHSPWRYRPLSHKTAHLGRERIILIGPRAQGYLKSYLKRDPESFCFSPAESEAIRKMLLRAQRKTRVQPSQVDRSKVRPKFKPADRYTRCSYNRAIRRACDLADEQAHQQNSEAPPEKRLVPRWTPNQLRHTAATEIRKKFGLEAAQVCLGHSAANVTQVYAERDVALGIEVMQEIG